ncbi:hypothetical protein DYB28_010849 [Aphanomyces astaci]|uniref:Uncharacterized protein n=1 Tax=Aphanomyces astaci TaxID=112090 RepID=A0A9X8EC60_APHAT|nr:hypothetical protein DYB28_010849 [Aphanomyces astaci]
MPLPTGKFACRHDIMLLQQVSLSRLVEPHAWILNGEEAAQTRFKYLLPKHEKGESASLRKSGTSEEYSEPDQLLTDIKLRVDDFAENEAVRKDAAKRKLEGVENSGLIMRQLAMAEL